MKNSKLKSLLKRAAEKNNGFEPLDSKDLNVIRGGQSQVAPGEGCSGCYGCYGCYGTYSGGPIMQQG